MTHQTSWLESTASKQLSHLGCWVLFHHQVHQLLVSTVLGQEFHIHSHKLFAQQKMLDSTASTIRHSCAALLVNLMTLSQQSGPANPVVILELPGLCT